MAFTQASGKIIWHADFEPEAQAAIPGPAVNNPDNWNNNVENPQTEWGLTNYRNDWPDTGRKGHGLIQRGNICAASGNTPIPLSPIFTDGIIELEMSWNDDDSMGVTFRAAQGKGYLVVFGYNETIALMLHDMGNGCAEPGMCLGKTGCDEPAWGGNLWIEIVLLADIGFEVGGKMAGHFDVWNRGILPEDHKHVLYGRIRAVGNQIDIWYMPIDKDFDRDRVEWMKPLISVRDEKYSSGTVGIWHESWGNGIIDNLTITDAGGFSADTRGKLTTYWGTIKVPR